MSQLSGALPYNLEKGFFWGAAIEIAATQLTRNKVVFEVYGGPGDPEISLFMDENDFLIMQMKDRDGKVSKTPPVNPMKFSFHRGFLIAEAYPEKGATGTMSMRLSMDRQFEVKGRARGSFGGDVEKGAHAFGADRNSDNPATFKLFELVVLNRAPLSNKEYTDLSNYMRRLDGTAHG